MEYLVNVAFTRVVFVPEEVDRCPFRVSVDIMLLTQSRCDVAKLVEKLSLVLQSI
jgi:hypothetical protein